MNNKNIGFAITGSFCTLTKIIKCIKDIVGSGNLVTPIFSYSVAQTDSRFITAAEFKKQVVEITGREPITSIVDAEPIGPDNKLDAMVIAPCTGNSLAKLNHGIIDTPVLMAAKAHLRNNKPVVIAISTNDGLSGNAKNLGELLNKRNIFFVPFKQDDCVKKSRSLMADFNMLIPAVEAALEGKQIQPIIKSV